MSTTPRTRTRHARLNAEALPPIEYLADTPRWMTHIPTQFLFGETAPLETFLREHRLPRPSLLEVVSERRRRTNLRDRRLREYGE